MASSILAAVDGRLDAATHAALTSHLAECPACRLALAEQQGVRRLLTELPLASVSADFAARVRQRVAHPWLDLANWRVWTLRLAPVAALLAILAASLPALTTSTSQSDTVSSALESWVASSSSSATSSTTTLGLLLNPEVDGNALVAASFQDTAR